MLTYQPDLGLCRLRGSATGGNTIANYLATILTVDEDSADGNDHAGDSGGVED